jgi:hypothetical protein
MTLLLYIFVDLQKALAGSLQTVPLLENFCDKLPRTLQKVIDSIVDKGGIYWINIKNGKFNSGNI